MKILLTVLAAMAAVTVADNNALEQLLVDGNNQFTTKLFSEVVKENPAQSFVLSAFSVMPPLAQLALASTGETHDELLNAISLKDDDTTKAVFSLVHGKLRSVKGVTLNMANRIYIPEDKELNLEFAKISNDVFQSEVKNVDFKKNVQTAQEINTWVEDHTNHRIKNLVSPNSLNENTGAVLVNALYFKGKWNEQFIPENTSDQDFYVNKETTIKVPTMKRRGSYKYGESTELNAKLLEMFYQGEEASLLLVLPNEVDGLAALEKKLQDPSALPKAIEKMYTTPVDVYLPKFKIETTTDLKKILEKINVKRLFTPGEAQLENLLKSAGNMYVSNAVQKAFIEINEEGAEAAAANEFLIPMMAPMVPPPPPPVFRADKPFYYEIKTHFNVTSNPQTFTIFNGVLTQP